MQTQSIRTTDSYNQNLKAFNKNTGFKGIGTMAMQGAGEFFKICDEIPMIGVSVTDTVATNIPRTLVDLHQTGIPAAAETARREFSGLFVNCLIPGGFVFGAAKLINNHFMKDYKAPNGKIVNMSSSWANGEAIRNLTGVWSEYTGLTRDVCEITDEKLKEEALNTLKTKNYTHTGFIKNALKKVEGLDGTDNWKRLSDYDSLIEKASELLAPAMDKTTTKKDC